VKQLSIRAAQSLWQPSGTYLNTASYGLPPRPAWDALQAALEDWRGGRTSFEGWDDAVETARGTLARLLGVPPDHVAVGATVSGLVGLLAASIPDGARVVAPDVEFMSLLFPFLAQERRGVRVCLVPTTEVAASIDSDTHLVALSAAQMSTGEVADLDAVVAAAAEHSALTVVDATQSAGWLPLDATRFDAVVVAAYKWLMSPRGTAFMAIRPELLQTVTPHSAGWFSTPDLHADYFGAPLRLAESARRLDTSPAWYSWVGTAATLDVVEQIGIDTIHDHDVGLANRFRAGLGLGPSDSAIVMCDALDAGDRLERAGIRAAVRGGRLRTSWHVYNTGDDVDATLDALVG
jgi:selenocysteine lyase/cysteine desulfurase